MTHKAFISLYPSLFVYLDVPCKPCSCPSISKATLPSFLLLCSIRSSSTCESGFVQFLQGDRKAILAAKDVTARKYMIEKLEHLQKSSQNVELGPTKLIEIQPKELNVSEPFEIPKSSTQKVKMIEAESLIEKEVPKEVTHESKSECEKSPIRSDPSKNNLQSCDGNFGGENEPSSSEVVNEYSMEKNIDVKDVVIIQHVHMKSSDMDVGDEQYLSRELQRTCSSLEPMEVRKKIVHEFPAAHSKSQSLEDFQELAEIVKEDIGSPCSQSSSLSHHSADKVMLKKHSYSQILPSRSKKIWWKLFLWSHRNMKKPSNPRTKASQLVSSSQQGGYSSDTLEAEHVKELSKLESPSSSSERNSPQRDNDNNELPVCEGFKIGVSGFWPQNQWAAFSGETSPLKKVDDWMNDHLEVQSTSSSNEEENEAREIIFPPSPEVSGGSMPKGMTHASSHFKRNLSMELLHANSVIQTLNSSSTIAHVSGMGLRIVPGISQFSALRSVNLSNNSIVQITSGSLPKGLHFLDLSRNKICNIEGLRELTRLRVVDLSYNRISRLGHGVANCRLLKELYLAGNKISEVEGLHRLHKLTVLDLSFNKIATKKAMGQIVANYSSLLALNILGNPIQKNLSEDQLRKVICELLPKLAYLNKQAVNQQKAREVSKDIVAKTTSRSNNWSVRRRISKKPTQNGTRLAGSKSSLGIAQRSKRTNTKMRVCKSTLNIST